MPATKRQCRMRELGERTNTNRKIHDANMVDESQVNVGVLACLCESVIAFALLLY